jgi:hypothetical protein
MPSTPRSLMALTVMLVLYCGSAIVSSATPVAIGFPHQVFLLLVAVHLDQPPDVHSLTP